MYNRQRLFPTYKLYMLEPLIETSKEVVLAVNTDKSMYTLLFRHQNAGKIRIMNIANRSLEKVAEFKYLGTTVTNQNLMHDEIKS
jgi:hypothetical protein